jgi:hypothetical protein
VLLEVRPGCMCVELERAHLLLTLELKPNRSMLFVAEMRGLIKLKEPMKQATGVTKCHELEAALSGLATTARVRLVALVAAVARPTFIPNYKRSHLCHLG